MRGEILTGVERRRRWSVEEKRRIVAETAVEGICLADIARQHDVTRQHIYQWRSELRNKGLLPTAQSAFVAVELTAADTVRGRNADIVVAREHHVEIGLRNGRSLRVAFDVPDVVLHRMIRIAEAS